MSNKDNYAIPSTSGQQQQLPNSPTLPQLHTFVFDYQELHGFKDSENQLCFPEVISTMLSDLDRFDIITVCEYLDIKIRPCSPDQLRVLKESKLLPEDSLSCGLVDYSSARQFYTYIQDVYKPLRRTQGLPQELNICHTLGSRCDGIYVPNLHRIDTSKCIMCQVCGKRMDPKGFILHSHGNQHHYDPNFNYEWREYIHLREELQTDILSKRMLSEFKIKFKEDPAEMSF